MEDSHLRIVRNERHGIFTTPGFTGVLVSGRGGGKTYQLIQWLMDGEKADNAVGWSRCLVVADMMRRDHLRRQYPDVKDYILTPGDMKNLRGRRRTDNLEYSVDDVAELLAWELGMGAKLPSLLSIHGSPLSRSLKDGVWKWQRRD